MCAERSPRGGVLLWLVLLTVGCASRAGSEVALVSFASRMPMSALERGTFASAPTGDSLEDEAGPLLHRRRAPQTLPGAGVLSETTSLPFIDALSKACGEVPPGWPRLSTDEEVLSPFLGCATPAAFLALQRTVDMPRLVESLSAWNAVRLGALGPMEAEAATVLLKKRVAFLATVAERHGPGQAEVLALFVLHTAFDDEVREVLRLLAEDKLLRRVLGNMELVAEELRQRGMSLVDFPERDFRAGDIARGLGRAADDVASSIPLVAGSRSVEVSSLPAQLPPVYRAAYQEVEKARYLGAFAPGNVALASFDHLTFGVPLGFYSLAAGAVHGGASLARGEYEEATRQLAPAALLVGLYAGGKGTRGFREAGLERQEGAQPQVTVPRVEALKAVLERVRARTGTSSVGELARHLQQGRESALLVAEWGEAGALALHEARGHAARAQALLAVRHGERPSGTPTQQGAGKSRGARSLPPSESAGIPAEVAEAKFRQVEAEVGGARLSMDVAALRAHRETLTRAAPPGADVHPLWADYLSYLEKRVTELQEGIASKGPLPWAGYQLARERFARGLAFERDMVILLEADAVLPRTQRRWLQDFEQPRIETHVGVAKADLRFADVLVIEARPTAGQPPRVETFSFKSRDLRRMDADALGAQMTTDARNALRYYGGTLDVLRKGIRQRAQVQRVRLVYEGKGLKPKMAEALDATLGEVQDKVRGVEVMVQ
ncbi:hypothetical protein LXT21_38750 [Myxococcus sp. K38C18041901]|uniref:hypothetical protein n=1 Tax=Myxococcus guangdongensis TaxID=2906760 RepID=UPI0020A7F4EA|nr:hypothetical protein [Myxococcus guangdongensis]MCP3064728.1 hypothetical protein [Myxococcus guangdongensis]